MMRRVCAWCSKDLGETEKFAACGDITHGICDGCALVVANGLRNNIQEILDGIEAPVFVIDKEGAVSTANIEGQEMLGKSLPHIQDVLGGDVFECAYAVLEDGCGKTEHCKTCAIRNAVMDTLSTGEPVVNVPAYQKINTPEGARILRFQITTERVGEKVLLRIEGVGQVER